MEFGEWVQRELNRRGWSQRELARRAGMSHTNVYKTLTGKQNVTFEFVQKVARVLGEPPEKLERMAGLRDRPRGESEPTLRELYEIAQVLSLENRQQITRIAALMLREQRESSRESGPDDTE